MQESVLSLFSKCAPYGTCQGEARFKAKAQGTAVDHEEAVIHSPVSGVRAQECMVYLSCDVYFLSHLKLIAGVVTYSGLIHTVFG